MECIGLVVQRLKRENVWECKVKVMGKGKGMSPTAVYECMDQFHILYLDNRQHSLVIVWIGLDLKALCGIPVNYRVGSSPRPCVWVIPVIYSQVDHHTCRAFVHVRLKLLGGTETQMREQKEVRIPECRDYKKTNKTGLGQRGCHR